MIQNITFSMSKKKNFNIFFKYWKFNCGHLLLVLVEEIQEMLFFIREPIKILFTVPFKLLNNHISVLSDKCLNMRASRVYITCTFILFLCTLVYVQSGEPPSLRKKINGLLILLLLLLLLLLLIKNYPLFENFSFQFSQHNPKKIQNVVKFS